MNRTKVAVITSFHRDFDARIWKHCKSLSNMGYSVDLICPWVISSKENFDGIRFHTFKRISSRVIRMLLVPFVVLIKLLRVINYIDIIHFHDIDLLPLMAFISLFKPVVYDVHENYPNEMIDREWIPKLLRKPLFYLVRWSQNLFSKVIKNLVLVTPEQLIHFDKEKLNSIVIWNYASLALLENVSDNYMERPDTIVFTGGGYRSNGTLLLLQIAALTKEIYPHVIFLLPESFTPRDFEKECKDLIVAYTLQETVYFYPRVSPDKIMDILNLGTIGIMPNLRVRKNEIAVPQKLFEFMAAGLPIVSSNLTYQERIFSKHQIGFLAEPENPHSFVTAIINLIEDRQLAYQLGKNAQSAFVNSYNWESQIPLLDEYYADILKRYISFLSYVRNI